MFGHEFVKCKACKKSRLKVKYEMEGWRVYICTHCGFIFVYPLKGKDFNKSVHDPQTVVTHHQYQYILKTAAQNRVKALLHHFKSLSGLKVLDVGCGNGYFLQTCKQIGMDVAGIEINKEAARYAKEHFSIPVTAIPPPYDRFFKEKSFDLVSLWGIIEHLDDPEIIVRAVRVLLKEQGTLIIQTNTEDAFVRMIVHTLNRITGKSYFIESMYQNSVGRHIQCFSKKSITSFLERLDFNISDIAYSTYGKKYMLKKELFMQASWTSRFLRVLAGSLYDVARICGRPNHILVFAKKESRFI